LQRDVLAGRAEACSLDDLLRIARLGHEDQLRQFEQLVTAPHRKRSSRTPAAASPSGTAETPTHVPTTVRLRVVAYFNQERFVEKRHRATAELIEIQAFVDDLNKR